MKKIRLSIESLSVESFVILNEALGTGLTPAAAGPPVTLEPSKYPCVSRCCNLT